MKEPVRSSWIGHFLFLPPSLSDAPQLPSYLFIPHIFLLLHICPLSDASTCVRGSMTASHAPGRREELVKQIQTDLLTDGH